MKRATHPGWAGLTLIASLLAASLAPAQSQPEWEVTGTVTAESGPVREARVIARGPAYRSAVTNGQGVYVLKGTIPGQYLVSVQKKDDFAVPPPRALSVAAGVRLKADFPLPRGAVISGRLLDSNRQPVRNFLVRAWSRSLVDGRLRFEEQGGDRTNDLGDFRIRHLPAGQFIVAATSGGLPLKRRSPSPEADSAEVFPPVTFYPGVRAPEEAVVLELRPGEEQMGIDIVLRKETARCIYFTVGKGFAGGHHLGAGVQERLAIDGLHLGEAKVEPGDYELCGAVPGECRIRITSIAAGQRLHVLAHQMAIVSVGKQHADAGILEPLSLHDVQGVVVIGDAGRDQAVPAEIQVSIFPQELQAAIASLPPARVASDGSFVLRGVLAGDYGVLVSAPPGYYVAGVEHNGQEVRERGFYPANGTLRIKLGADGATVTGQVVGTDKETISDAVLFPVSKNSGARQVAYSSQDGSFRFQSVRPGKYRLAAMADAVPSSFIDDATVAQVAAQGMDLDLGPRDSRHIEIKLTMRR
jgi:hypothetical protein